MTTFLYSAIANGATIAFNAAMDVLSFDDPAVSGWSITYSSTFTQMDVTVSLANTTKTFTLTGFTIRDVTTTNTVFADGSVWLVGDNAVGNVNDDSPNSLTGTAHNDFLMGRGGDGNDVIMGGAGVDILDGGAGTNVWSSGGPGAIEGVVLNLATGVVGNDGYGNAESLVNFQYVNSGSFDDSLTGDNNANRLRAYSGNDTVLGGDGNDTIRGGAGNDSLDGGSGSDWWSAYDATQGAVVSLGGTGTSQVVTNDGFGTADAIANFENLAGGALADSLTGDANGNVLEGNGGDDTVQGYNGDDTLFGGDGNDRLFGDGGTNILYGGDRNDVLFSFWSATFYGGPVMMR